METWHIHIEGIVQGVGFRPFVYLLAKREKLKGWVSNTPDGVHIEINSSKRKAISFLDMILFKAPVLSQITNAAISQVPLASFTDFQIIGSQPAASNKLLITPDIAICENCRSELMQWDNRRKSYSFITCTMCGPRYSIMHSLPYDRENTTMDSFSMCKKCQEEYEDLMDRRFYSQTNSCPNCPVSLQLLSENGTLLTEDQNEIIDKICELWAQGKIIAIKGIGGYLITCDASKPSVVRELRKRKNRPHKPFALMIPDIGTIDNVIKLSREERKLLDYPISPILLLNVYGEIFDDLAVEEVAPGLQQIGVMLPYTPIFQLLMLKFGRAIVATSGNVSNSPIVFRDEDVIPKLSEVIDYYVSHNRHICVPQDDSVLKVSKIKQKRIIIRRSRGMAPAYINSSLKWSPDSILATGAMLKSSFGLLHKNNIYISQYLGDLQHYDTEVSFQHSMNHLLGLFDVRPDGILVDKHPEYASTRYGIEIAKKMEVPVYKFQHHIAHFGAILGEHTLIHCKKPILGVIWDGTGLGDDGHIWGGEFFIYQNMAFYRIAYFDYYDFILGDKMPREPRISAFSLSQHIEDSEELLKAKFSKTEWNVYKTIMSRSGGLKTSSLGRIFDAVASLLEIMDVQTFEGEAAIRLEQLAWDYYNVNDLNFSSYYVFYNDEGNISTHDLFQQIIQDINSSLPLHFIAAKFHYSLVLLIEFIAIKNEIKMICFSGGVFQNSLLVDLIIHHLNDQFELFFHEQFSPNDENISFGQLVCHQINQLRFGK